GFIKSPQAQLWTRVTLPQHHPRPQPPGTLYDLLCVEVSCPYNAFAVRYPFKRQTYYKPSPARLLEITNVKRFNTTMVVAARHASVVCNRVKRSAAAHSWRRGLP